MDSIPFSFTTRFVSRQFCSFESRESDEKGISVHFFVFWERSTRKKVFILLNQIFLFVIGLYEFVEGKLNGYDYWERRDWDKLVSTHQCKNIPFTNPLVP